MDTRSTRVASQNGVRLAETARTSVSFSKPVYQDALKVASAAGYRSFSGYLEELMRRDNAERKSHCVA